MSTERIKTILDDILKDSEFLKNISPINELRGRSLIHRDGARDLKRSEIDDLIKRGNYSPDWNKIKVSSDFNTEFIRNNIFYGQCLLGSFSGRDIRTEVLPALKTGIYNSTVLDSEIDDECLIHDTGCLSNYLIKKNSAISRVDLIRCAKDTLFGNGIEITVGNETGGREVISFADMTLAIAESVALRRDDTEFMDFYTEFIQRYTDSLKCGFGIVESNACLCNTKSVIDSYIGRGVSINGAVLVKNSTLLGSMEEKTAISHGAYINGSCIQWGSEVTSMAIVERSVLTEHSHVDRHAKVTDSIIGPNTAISEGEITSCLVGPFTGFHHQAMLIAAIWPEGKGNVGYGANIGSNHTSKAPDQEIFCGEGTFFGLGVNIKYPSDFRGSPYSIIATGVDTLPQRVEFPFSLINNPAETIAGLSPSINELIPGWVLSDNIYSLLRNEGKYKERDRAKRSRFEYGIFRPEIIDMIIAARDRLIDHGEDKAVYTVEIAGSGKNYIKEENRVKGIETYKFFIEYYSLNGLFKRLSQIIKSPEKEKIEDIYDNETDSALWEHERSILHREGFALRDIKTNLGRLIEIVEKIIDLTLESKEKDEIRGKLITADYLSSHIKAWDDPFIAASSKKFRETIESIRKTAENL